MYEEDEKIQNKPKPARTCVVVFLFLRKVRNLGCGLLMCVFLICLISECCYSQLLFACTSKLMQITMSLMQVKTNLCCVGLLSAHAVLHSLARRIATHRKGIQNSRAQGCAMRPNNASFHTMEDTKPRGPRGACSRPNSARLAAIRLQTWYANTVSPSWATSVRFPRTYVVHTGLCCRPDNSVLA